MEAVILKAINRSHHDLNVTSVGIELQDGSRNVYTVIAARLPSESLPGPVRAHGGTAQTWFDPGELASAGINVKLRTVAQVRIEDGSMFRSKPSRLLR